MNSSTQVAVYQVLLTEKDPKEKLESIVKIVDADMAKVLAKVGTFGEILEAVGLEIVPKC